MRAGLLALWCLPCSGGGHTWSLTVTYGSGTDTYGVDTRWSTDAQVVWLSQAGEDEWTYTPTACDAMTCLFEAAGSPYLLAEADLGRR